MKILVVDDGQLAINSLVRILCRVAPDCDYISAMTTEDALTWMRQGPMDAAFLNLEMPGMNGLGLARMIQKLQPRCNIIVVTEHPEYALEALQIFVSGFLLKPANEDDVKNVLKHLRYPPEDGPAGVKIQCFGNFEIFVNGRTLAFKRSKSKELLAYLVDRNGATCTNGEMLAVLWEDKRVYDPVFLGRGDPLGAAPAGKRPENGVHSQLLRADRILKQKESTALQCFSFCRNAFSFSNGHPSRRR